MVVLEGIAFSFWMLLICVVGIADGPVGMVVFYEQDVKDRVVELGLTTKEKIRRTSTIVTLLLFVPMFTVIPAVVCLLNGAEGFWDRALQIGAIYLIAGLFDRLFIDWYWVGRTKAWLIPGTEDLKPYIPRKTAAVKWLGTVVGFPILALILSGVIQLFTK